MTKLTRRTFVHASAAAAATASLASRAAFSQSPNEKMAVAIVGAGGRGGTHIGAFQGNSRTQILYIVDADETRGNSRADGIAKKQGSKPKVVKDMRAAFDDKSVDIVSTATPNHWHALCGVWAMQAGKDTYIEKPICHNVAEGAALIAAAKKYKRMCQVGTQCRSHAAIQNAMKFLHEGGIGEVNFARGLCYKRRKSIGPLGNYPVPSEVDFDLWSGPALLTEPKCTRQRFHYDWHWQRLYGNGDLGNQGPHQTDIARWGLGLDRHPNSIVSYGGRLGYKAERKDPSYRDAGDTANTEVSIYDYGDKCIVFETRGLDVTDTADDEINKLFQSRRGNKIGVVFYGSEGYLVQRTYGHCIAYDKDMKVMREFNGTGDHFGNFINACISRDAGKLNADAREGHLSAAISHLGNISYYLGEDNKVDVQEARERIAMMESLDDDVKTFDRTIQHLKDNKVDLKKYPISFGPQLKFDPEEETFLNNSDANALLTRAYRTGFECPKADEV